MWVRCGISIFYCSSIKVFVMLLSGYVCEKYSDRKYIVGLSVLSKDRRLSAKKYQSLRKIVKHVNNTENKLLLLLLLSKYLN